MNGHVGDVLGLCLPLCLWGYNGKGRRESNIFVPLPTKERWMGMRRTALLVAAVMAALVLTMPAGPLSQQGLSPDPAQARMPALRLFGPTPGSSVG